VLPNLINVNDDRFIDPMVQKDNSCKERKPLGDLQELSEFRQHIMFVQIFQMFRDVHLFSKATVSPSAVLEADPKERAHAEPSQANVAFCIVSPLWILFLEQKWLVSWESYLIDFEVHCICSAEFFLSNKQCPVLISISNHRLCKCSFYLQTTASSPLYFFSSFQNEFDTLSNLQRCQ